MKKLGNSYVFIAGAFLAIALLGGCQRDAKDKDLISVFHSKRKAFESIVSMLAQDSNVEAITLDHVLMHSLQNNSKEKFSLASEPSSERLLQYRALLKEVGANGVYVWQGGGEIMFYYSEKSYSIKGISFWARNLRLKMGGEIETSLDDESKLPQEGGHVKADVYLEPIEDDWCLFLYSKD